VAGDEVGELGLPVRAVGGEQAGPAGALQLLGHRRRGLGQHAGGDDAQTLQPLDEAVELGRVHLLDVARCAPDGELHPAGREHREDLGEALPAFEGKVGGDDPEAGVRLDRARRAG
jgi:hypothetical protein